MTKRKRKKPRYCVDCGAVLKQGYWRRCDFCWKKMINDGNEESDFYQLVIKIDEDNA